MENFVSNVKGDGWFSTSILQTAQPELHCDAPYARVEREGEIVEQNSGVATVKGHKRPEALHCCRIKAKARCERNVAPVTRNCARKRERIFEIGYGAELVRETNHIWGFSWIEAKSAQKATDEPRPIRGGPGPHVAAKRHNPETLILGRAE